MSDRSHATMNSAWWLVRIPQVFGEFTDLLAPSSSAKDGEGDYRRVGVAGIECPLDPDIRMFCRWQMPVHHAWPCNPERTAGFIEKAARAIAEKFAPNRPVAILVGAFEPNVRNGYYRKLAANLRGRVLQCMPSADRDADTLEADDMVVHVLVGKTGLFCGLHTPRNANGFYPGGTKFIRQSGDEVLSRAGAKIAEALHHMRMFGAVPDQCARWLELGASPGGMTSELLRRGYHVTAIDRAPLDPALQRAERLDFSIADVALWNPHDSRRFNALLCDMNGPAEYAFSQVVRMSKFLHTSAPVVFTLKTTGAEGIPEIVRLHHDILASVSAAGMRHLQTTHLSYNRREFTMFLTV